MALSLAKRDKAPPPAVSLVEERLQTAKDDRLSAEQQWALNMAFYEGKQWVYFNKTTNRIQVPPAPLWRVRHTANYITSMVYTLLAKLSRKRPDMHAVPATGEEEDINAARKSTQLLEYIWGELNLTEKRYQLMLWALITGKAFLKVYWDRSAGPRIEDTLAAEGHPEEGVTVEVSESISFNLGDVCVEVRSPYQVGVDPGAATVGTLDGANWVTDESIRDVDDIEAEWDVKVPPEDVSGERMVQAIAGGMSKGDNAFDGGGSKRLKHHAVVKEYWQRPTPAAPDGRYIVVASGQVLHDGPLPYVAHTGERDLPFVEFSHVVVPGKFWCRSVVDDLIGPQKAINVAISRLMEIQNLMAMPKLMYQTGSMDAGKWTSEPGQMVAYSGVPPVPWTPQVFPQGVFQMIEMHLDTMYKLSGVREFALSGAPTGATSGVALNLLAEQDETRLGPVIDMMENGLARVGTKILQLIQGDGTDDSPYGYVEPRTIRVTGKSGLIETLDFYASDVRFADVRVEAGSSLPKSKAAQQQFVIELVQAGILNPEQDRDRILKLLDIGSIESEVDEALQDELFAELENRRLQQGQPQMAHPWENHAVHIREHNNFRKRDIYEQLPDEIKAMFEQHVEQHKALMVKVEQEQALMALVPQLTVAKAQAQAAAAAQQEAAVQAGVPPGGAPPPPGPPGPGGGPLPAPGPPGIPPPMTGVPAA